MKTILALALSFASFTAHASPQTACREEALASADQAIESQFQGNERLEDDLKAITKKLNSGYAAVVVGNSIDYHKYADAVPRYVTTVKLTFDKDCGELTRTISKKQK